MTEPSAVRLDEAVLERLAAIICGDDERPFYRRGFEIVKFFRAAGWSVPDDMDGESRRAWTIARLLARRDDGEAVTRLLLRLADPREYLDERQAHEQVVDEMNELLAVEGIAVVDTGSRPRLVERAGGTGAGGVPRPAVDEPAELNVDVEELVSDPELGAQLRRRLDEAQRCRAAGAPTAAVIMLGSVLEGVLYDVALSRSLQGSRDPTDHLQSLIDLAHQNRWITKDIVDYAHVLRDHRNLVHPKKQWTQAYSPTDRVALIAWNVVVATFTDLADSGRIREVGSVEAGTDAWTTRHG